MSSLRGGGTTLRSLARICATIVVGAVVGTLGWQVAFAADPLTDTLVVCQRPGADLRSPATNGTCPSGYTRTEITETPAPVPPRTYSAGPAANAIYPAIGAGQNILAVQVPPGRYAISATGWVENDQGTAALDCFLNDSVGGVDLTALTQLTEYIGVAGGSGSLSGVRTYEAPTTTVWVHCILRGSNAIPSVTMGWDLTATRVEPPA